MTKPLGVFMISPRQCGKEFWRGRDGIAAKPFTFDQDAGIGQDDHLTERGTRDDGRPLETSSQTVRCLFGIAKPTELRLIRFTKRIHEARSGDPNDGGCRTQREIGSK